MKHLDKGQFRPHSFWTLILLNWKVMDLVFRNFTRFLKRLLIWARHSHSGHLVMIHSRTLHAQWCRYCPSSQQCRFTLLWPVSVSSSSGLTAPHKFNNSFGRCKVDKSLRNRRVLEELDKDSLILHLLLDVDISFGYWKDLLVQSVYTTDIFII